MPELADIVGQDAAISRLQRAMAGGRLPHAYIFAGPRGVGRRTTALALAKTLLCEKPVTVKKPPDERSESAGNIPFRQACGHCEDCRMMDAGSHGDFHLVYKELAAYHDDPDVRGRKMQDLSIDVVRTFLIAPAYRSSARGRGRAFVVLDAEAMSTPAQNALLKTLEEPPPGVTIILICQSGQQLLPTTLSRCSIVRFNPLPRDFVAGALAERGLPQAEAKFWADFTAGSLGRSITLHEQGLYDLKCRLLESLGRSDEVELAEELVSAMDELAAAAEAEAKKAGGPEVARTVASRAAASILLELLASAFRDALHAATGRGGTITNGDQKDAIESLARHFDASTLADMIRQLSDYEELLWRNVNPKTVWDNVAITCVSGAPLKL